MSNITDLKVLERKAFRSYHQDGLMDISLGLMMMVAFISEVFIYGSMPEIKTGIVEPVIFRIILGLGLYLTPVVIVYAGKRFITTPRLGSVKLGSERLSRNKKAKVVILSAVLVTWAVLIISMVTGWTEVQNIVQWMPVIIGGGVTLVMSLMAYFIDFPRLAVIGALMGLGIAFREWLDKPVMLLISGLLILVTGLVIFWRFLREHPISEREAVNDQV